MKECGLYVSLNNPWLAASPDVCVYQSNPSQILGLVEFKNPLSLSDKTISKADSCKTFCLEKKNYQ